MLSTYAISRVLVPNAQRAEVVGVAEVVANLALLERDAARPWKMTVSAVVAEIRHDGGTVGCES